MHKHDPTTITIPPLTQSVDEKYIKQLTDALKQIQRELSFWSELITVDSDGIIHFKIEE